MGSWMQKGVTLDDFPDSEDLGLLGLELRTRADDGW